MKIKNIFKNKIKFNFVIVIILIIFLLIFINIINQGFRKDDDTVNRDDELINTLNPKTSKEVSNIENSSQIDAFLAQLPYESSDFTVSVLPDSDLKLKLIVKLSSDSSKEKFIKWIENQKLDFEVEYNFYYSDIPEEIP